MSTRKIKKYFIRTLFVLCVLIISNINALAYSSLLGVDVKQTAIDNFSVILKIDKNVKIKKISDTKDNLTLLLNSTVPADSVDIVYDNTSDLKNVIVQKKNSDNTMIFLQGKNIENSSIYTKELSTGSIKPIENNMKSLNNYLYIANVKYFTFGIIGFILLFLLMLSLRPKSKKYVPKYNVKPKHQTINSMKQRNIAQKRYVPSINYRISSSKSNMTMPKTLIISQLQENNEEKIRKAG